MNIKLRKENIQNAEQYDCLASKAYINLQYELIKKEVRNMHYNKNKNIIEISKETELSINEICEYLYSFKGVF